MKIIIIVTLFTLASTAQAATLLQRLATAGFACSTYSNGQICINNTPRATGFTYPQPVVVLVPANVENPTQVLLHLHGFRGICEAADASAATMAEEFNFAGQIQQAGVTNSVLIIPISTGNCDTYTASLIPQFAGFEAWMESLIQPASDTWVVSGHSGAGAILAQIFAQNQTFTAKIKTVILMDALYSMPTYIGDWEKAATFNATMTIYSVYTTPDGTGPGNTQLKESIKNKVNIAVANPNVHCEVPTEYGVLLKEAEAGTMTATRHSPSRDFLAIGQILSGIGSRL